MIQQVQNSFQLHGLPGDDANKHLDKFLHVTQSIKMNGVTVDALRLYRCQTQNVYVAGAYQGGNSYQPQGRNQFFQGASHGLNLPPTYQASAYQAPGYQAPVHQPPIPQPQVVTTTEFTNCMKVNDAILKNMQTNMTSLTNFNLELKNMFGQFMKINTASFLGSGTLPSNTITNPKEDLKGTTTRSGTAYQGPTSPTTSSSLPKVVERKTEVIKDTVPPTNNESTKDVQPPVVHIETPIPNSEPVVAPVSAPKPNQKPSIPFADALILLPKFGPTIKNLLTNKDKLSELARTPLNEHYLAVLLKKLPENLGDPGKFLIPCDFLRMDECLALADLGASINLMPLSVWNKLSLPELSPMCMTLELTDRLISRPVGVAEVVFVKVGTFYFPTDFIVIDFDADPRVPLILERSFLKTERDFIDVFERKLTLRVGKEAITFDLDQTLRYSANYNDMTANRIDVIDMSCEEYSQEVLGFSDVIASGNPGILGDKIICDLDKTPDFSQRSPQNCPNLDYPNLEPFNNKTIKELPPTVQSFDPKSDLAHNSPNVFNPPPQLPFISCEFCGNDARYGHYCTPQVLFVYPEPCYNQDLNFPQEFQDFYNFQQQDFCCENCGVTHEAYQCQPKNQEQNSCYDSNSFGFDQFQPQQYTVNHPVFNVQNELFDSQNKLMEQLTSMCDMVGQFIQKKEEEKKTEEEQAAKARYWKIPACYDDNDDYAFAITPNEPVNSLSMGDEHLDTIPAMKSDEFIKSSVENLVSITSESKDEHECDVLAREKFTTFSNILFDSDYDFYSINDQTFYDEDIDFFFDEFADELTFLKSIPSGIDETDCNPEEEIRLIEKLLYDNSSPRPPEEFDSANSDAKIESFSPSPIPFKDSNSLMEEINLSFTPDYPMPSGIEDDDYDSERDILILKDLLSNDTFSHPEIESFHFYIPSFSSPPAKPPDGEIS
nr:hypothetical protein [Tanacetum cinerariifolium]